MDESSIKLLYSVILKKYELSKLNELLCDIKFVLLFWPYGISATTSEMQKMIQFSADLVDICTV